MEISRKAGWIAWPANRSAGVSDRDLGRLLQIVPEQVPIF